MKILLDTNVLVWTISDVAKLKPKLRRMLSDPENELLVSHVSLWELAIKMGRGRLSQMGSSLHLVVDEMREQRIEQLSLTLSHLFRLEYLEPIHQDPFDRLLIAQALTEDLPVATADAAFRQYGVKVLW